MLARPRLATRDDVSLPKRCTDVLHSLLTLYANSCVRQRDHVMLQVILCRKTTQAMLSVQAQVTSSEQGSGKGAFSVRLEGPANLWGTCLVPAHLLLAHNVQYMLYYLVVCVLSPCCVTLVLCAAWSWGCGLIVLCVL